MSNSFILKIYSYEFWGDRTGFYVALRNTLSHAIIVFFIIYQLSTIKPSSNRKILTDFHKIVYVAKIMVFPAVTYGCQD